MTRSTFDRVIPEIGRDREPRRRSPMSIALLMLACLSMGPAAPDGPASDIPELKVLDHWAGRWDSESTISADANPPAKPTRETAMGQWVLGGRYLRQDWDVPSQGDVKALSGSTLMTYDPRKKTYQSWSF